MMRIRVFYCDLEPRCAAALERFAPGAVYVDTSASLRSYGEELEKLWTGEDDLVLIEQDKEITGDVLPQFSACSEPWCAFTYWIYPEPHTNLVIGGFGVTKFSAAVQKLIPYGLWGPGPRKEWQGIDARFYKVAVEKYGIGCHLHGHVVHHHVYPPRPAAVRDHVARLRQAGVLAPAVYPEPPAAHLLPGSYDLNG